MNSLKSIVKRKEIKSNTLPAGVADMLEQMNGFEPLKGNFFAVPKRLDFWLDYLSGGEFKVLFYIIRHTWGYDKKMDFISIDQIKSGIVRRDGVVADTGTGLSRRWIFSAIKALIGFGLIKKTTVPGHPSGFSLSYPHEDMKLGQGGAVKCTPPMHINAPTISYPILNTKKILKSTERGKSRARELYLRGLEAFNREKIKREQISSKM